MMSFSALLPHSSHKWGVRTGSLLTVCKCCTQVATNCSSEYASSTLLMCIYRLNSSNWFVAQCTGVWILYDVPAFRLLYPYSSLHIAYVFFRTCHLQHVYRNKYAWSFLLYKLTERSVFLIFVQDTCVPCTDLTIFPLQKARIHP